MINRSVLHAPCVVLEHKPHLRKITNGDIILYVLYKCGGAETFIHTEILAFEVCAYPEGMQRFRWQTREIPDKGKVSRELRRMRGGWRDRKYGVLVKGKVDSRSGNYEIDGWMLTEAGLDRVQKLLPSIETLLSISKGTYYKYDKSAIYKRLQATDCYRIYKKDRTLFKANRHDLSKLLKCLSDSPRSIIKESFENLMLRAKAVEATDLVDFLNAVREHFKDILS